MKGKKERQKGRERKGKRSRVEEHKERKGKEKSSHP